MADYIDREKAIEQTIACFDDPLITGTIVDALEDVPKVERKRGKWLEVFYGIVCDVCGGAIADDAYKRHFMPDGIPNFCPFCGADMRPNEAVKTEGLNEQIQC